MTRPCRIIVLGIIVVLIGLPVARARSDPNTKIADRFEVSLTSSELRDSVPTSVILSSEDPFGQATGHLRLSCEIGISDPNLILGISRRGKITQVRTDEGEILDVIDQESSGRTSSLHIYHAPRYRRQFVAPIKVPKWKKTIRSILRLPPAKISLPQWSDKLVPSRMTLELSTALLGPDVEKISRVEGHFYVLVADSLENIDVPFKPSEKWVRLTSDLEIRVAEARTTGSQYNFRIETRRGERYFMTPFSPGSDLPNRFPVGRQLLAQDGKATGRRSGPIFGLASMGGRGSGGGIGPIEKIRFVIAVNPSHHKIPFVLEDIPLPER